jgi:hypothetical protein
LEEEPGSSVRDPKASAEVEAGSAAPSPPASAEVDAEVGGSLPAEESSASPPADPHAVKPSRLRRLAPLVLVAGALISVLSIAPHLPRDRQVELRFEEPTSIIGVSVDWTSSSEEPVQGGSWRFAAGTAPRSLATKVRLPNGAYEVDIRIDRVDRVQTVKRSIPLGDADTIAVPVR